MYLAHEHKLNRLPDGISWCMCGVFVDKYGNEMTATKPTPKKKKRYQQRRDDD